MLNRLSILKDNFSSIIEIRKNVKIIFEILHDKIYKLKQFYQDFIANNNTQLFIFGLDSFYFQSKMIDIEYEDMKRLFLAMNNRIYCEYFKLHKIIIYYINENISDKKILESIKTCIYPIYKDLEPFKEYDFELINDIHENVFDLILQIITYTEHKEKELIIHTSKKNIGLNIDNFVNTFNYDIIIMKEKINLFIKYIEFFHKLHTKHFKRLSNKIQLMYNDISHDINFEEQIITEERIISYETESQKNNKIYNDSESINDSLNHSNNGSINDSNDESINSKSPSNIVVKKDLKSIFKKNVNKITALNRFKNINKNNTSLNVNNVVDSINDICDSLINNNENNNNINDNIDNNENNDNIDDNIGLNITEIDDKINSNF